MSELGDVVSLFWAVDDAAKAGGDRREAIAKLLPVYATTDPAVAPDDWVRRFDALSPGFTEGIRPPDPDGASVVEALSSMAERGLPRGRLRSRRLLAIAALTRAYPEQFGEDGSYRRTCGRQSEASSKRRRRRPTIPSNAKIWMNGPTTWRRC